MKTLDEVIEWMENIDGCSYISEGMRKNALHYLKEYQRYQDTPSRIGHMAMVDLEQNLPLIWDELKQMEGKPVWIENQFYRKWLIAYKVNGDDIIFDGNGFYTQAFTVDYGKTWNAYRKERTA